MSGSGRSRLSAVPSSAPAGLDVAELRRSAGLPADSPALHAVETAPPTDEPAEHGSPLHAAQNSLRRLELRIAERSAELARAQAALDKADQARAEVERLEEAAREPFKIWVSAGAHGEPPVLESTTRAELAGARETAASMELAAGAIEAGLPVLRDSLGQLQAALPSARQAVVDAALETLAADFVGVLAELRDARRQASRARERGLALLRVLREHNYRATLYRPAGPRGEPAAYLYPALDDMGRELRSIGTDDLSDDRIASHVAAFHKRIEQLTKQE